MWWVSIVKRARGPRSCLWGRDHRSSALNQYLPVHTITDAVTLGDNCSELRVESAPGWGVEAAWWGDDAVVTRSGGLSRESRRYNWRVLCLIYVTFSAFNLTLGFSL